MKNVKLKQLFSRGGFSLVELSVATGIVMISLVAAGNIVQLIYQSSAHLDSLVKQNNLKGIFISQILNESNWFSTYADPVNMSTSNAKMACLYNHTDCSALVGVQTQFRVVNANLNVIYDATTSNNNSGGGGGGGGGGSGGGSGVGGGNNQGNGGDNGNHYGEINNGNGNGNGGNGNGNGGNGNGNGSNGGGGGNSQSSTPNGFNPLGSTCTGYGAVSDTCPYQYVLTWTPLCKAGAKCVDPLVKVQGVFNINFASQHTDQPNTSNYVPMQFSLIMSMKMQNTLYAIPPVLMANWRQTGQNYQAIQIQLPNSSNAVGSITLVSASQTGYAGGTVTTSGNTINYTPPTNFYGLDFLDYKFKDSIGNQGTNRVWIKIMTPFTWTGDGTNSNASNAVNWCGNVSNGSCSHNANPASNSSNSLPHLVFNQNCTRCSSVNLDISNLDGIEIYSSFPGVIAQSQDLQITTNAASWGGTTAMQPNFKHQGYYQAGGTFRTGQYNMTNTSLYLRAPTYPGPAPLTNFYLQAGQFSTSATTTLTSVSTGLQIDAGVNFQNAGTLVLQKAYLMMDYVATGNGINLGVINFSGGVSPFIIGSNLNVTNLTLDGAHRTEAGLCGTGVSQINVTGSIKAINSGGNTYCTLNRSNLQIVLAAPNQQSVSGFVNTDPVGTSPGYIPNLVTNPNQITTFAGAIGLEGDTNFRGPIYAGTSSVLLHFGTFVAAVTPHFYNASYVGGNSYVLNSNVYVDNDFSFDRCLADRQAGSGCGGFNIGTPNGSQIFLTGNLHLLSGIMDLNSTPLVTVNFIGSGNQLLSAEGQTSNWGNTINMVSAPAIAVNKPSGSFGISETSAACIATGRQCLINFMGPISITSAGSVTQFTGTDYFFGNMQGFGTLFLSSYVPLDFGTANIYLYSSSAYDLGGVSGGSLKARSVQAPAPYGGAFKNGTLTLSGDFNIGHANYYGGNATVFFTGGGTHNYSSVNTFAHNLTVDVGDIVTLGANVSDVSNLNLLGTLNQNSQTLNFTNLTGSGIWNRNGASYTGNISGFTGITN